MGERWEERKEPLWTNPYSTTSVPTPAAPPAPVADMHWQQHHFIASAPEEEPPLPAAWPEATKSSSNSSSNSSNSSSSNNNNNNNSNKSNTSNNSNSSNNSKPTAHSPQPTSTAALERKQAQQHWREPGGVSSPRPFGYGVVLVVLVVIWLYSHLCHLHLLSKGTRNSRILARSPAILDHVANQIIPQCKLHASALMLMTGTYKTLTTDRGPPYLLMAYSPNK